MSRKENMKRLEALRDQLKREIVEIQQKLAGVEMAIRAVNGEPAQSASSTKAPRVNVKQLLFQLLEERGNEGLNAAIAVELASSRNEKVERNTVSSLLSRFKSEGVVSYDGTVYRLKKFGEPTKDAQEAPAVH